MSKLKKVVIIGGGFAGLYAIKELSEYGYRFEITLIDKNKFATLKPKLTSIAAAKIVENIKVEIPPILREHNAAWANEEVESIDTKNQVVYTKDDSYKYDYLIIASGIEHDYKEFSNKEYYSFASYKEALRLEEAISNFTHGTINIVSLENSLYEGVAIEVAFLIEERLRDLGIKELCNINLITKNSTIFPEVGQKSKEVIKKELDCKDINIQENSSFDSIKEDDLTIILPSFKVPSFAKDLPQEQNGIKTNEYMQVLDYPNICAVGDINTNSIPKLGHNAFKQAKIAVETILKEEALIVENSKYSPDILAVIEVDKIDAILIYSNTYFNGDIDFAIKSIFAKELKIIFKNALYFSLGKIPQKLDDTIKKIIQKYIDS